MDLFPPVRVRVAVAVGVEVGVEVGVGVEVEVGVEVGVRFRVSVTLCRFTSRAHSLKKHCLSPFSSPYP